MDQILALLSTPFDLSNPWKAILIVGILYWGYVSIWSDMRRLWAEVKEE